MWKNDPNAKLRIAYVVPPLMEMEMSRGKKAYRARANWVLVTDVYEQNAYVQEYALRTFSLYDGVPPWEFVSDEHWKSLPKKWTYNTDLTAPRKAVDEARLKDWETFGKTASLKDPKALQAAIEQGFFIPRHMTHVHVNAEIDHKKYRLVRTVEDRPNDSDTRRVPLFELYNSYEEAETQAEGMIAERLARLEVMHRADVANAVHEISSMVPSKYQETVRFLLANMEFEHGFSIRFYNGKVLLRETVGRDWKVIWEVPECFEK